MSLNSPRTLTSTSYSASRYVPCPGEIILIRLSENLPGPGSRLTGVQDSPSKVNGHNFHHAIVLQSALDCNSLDLTVLPVPTYTSADTESRLASAMWLLQQPPDVQSRHIPMPYEQAAATEVHPPFPTPASFGAPLKIDGWKATAPSWVVAVPQATSLKWTTNFKHFNPRLVLGRDELCRLIEYSKSAFQLAESGAAGEDAAIDPEDPSLAQADPLQTQASGQSSGHNEGKPDSGGSAELQALYASPFVKRAYEELTRQFDESRTLCLAFDEDYEDDGEEWEDNMDPVTFARYYASQDPHFAMIVEEHDRWVRENLERDTVGWLDGLVSAGAPGMMGDQGAVSCHPLDHPAGE